MFGGFGASTFTGSTGGADTLVGRAGANTFNMTNGDIAFGGPNGSNTYNIGSGSTLPVDGTGVSQINVGSGLSTDFAGSGLDTYTIKSGTNDTANIIGFKAGDHISLTGSFTAADAFSAVSKATMDSFGTTLHLFGGSVTSAGQRRARTPPEGVSVRKSRGCSASLDLPWPSGCAPVASSH